MIIVDSHNAPPAKITVRIKGDDTVLKKEDLVYDEFKISYDDDILRNLVKTVAKQYPHQLTGEEDITVTIKMTWAHRPEVEALEGVDVWAK